MEHEYLTQQSITVAWTTSTQFNHLSHFFFLPVCQLAMLLNARLECVTTISNLNTVFYSVSVGNATSYVWNTSAQLNNLSLTHWNILLSNFSTVA